MVNECIAVADHLLQLTNHLSEITIPFWTRRRSHFGEVSNGWQQVPMSLSSVGQSQLLQLNFTWTNISKMYGVSQRTMYRLRELYGLTHIPRFTSISNEELQDIASLIKHNLPDIGERMLAGVLRSLQVHVPRRRVRETLHTVDPINTALRWSTKITRRQYCVPGPNSLWHIGRFNCSEKDN